MLGDVDGKPFSVAKIASYMCVPRTTVLRRLNQLRRWGLIDREGRRYYEPAPRSCSTDNLDRVMVEP
jgi:DNA-binding IclR family transcriptional regulator